MENSIDEKRLIRLLSGGDEKAFEKLYMLYSEKIYICVLRVIKSKPAATEILHDIFLKVWDNRVKIDPDKNFCAFIHCIATNCCYDFFRKMSRDKKLLIKLTGSARNSYTHIEEKIIKQENLEIIRRAVNSLPVKRREIFVLCKFNGKSYDEVSRKLGISSSTISDHIVKANQFIRNFILQESK